ncbi:unnamed protein product [Thlaspi arvense]|uniref:Secreted protein n=1 Tax=Thlaspi arvense TaxID=13288 RepID=A0AAU9SLD2_THLAR|nr:unnamed protein product [Thlaspi arvense]
MHTTYLKEIVKFWFNFSEKMKLILPFSTFLMTLNFAIAPDISNTLTQVDNQTIDTYMMDTDRVDTHQMDTHMVVTHQMDTHQMDTRQMDMAQTIAQRPTQHAHS